MKNIIGSICLVLLLGACQNQQNIKDQTSPEVPKLAKKSAPSENESLMLFGPEPQKEDIDAYRKSIKQDRISQLNKSDKFNGEWTNQGPGNIGGRINALALHPTDDNIIYAGFARGGLWKTTNSGADWEPLWNEQAVQSVSAITLDPNDPDIIYAGTGDVNISGSTFVGDGLYKSVNAGETWEYLGLKEAYIIGDIIINPENTQQITVATMGLPAEENQDRGIYFSNDGGQNWTQTLFVDDQSGVTEIAYQDQAPSVLLAASWTRIRTGKKSTISGEGSGIFRSIDNGQNWTKLEFPVPDTMGRTAVCFSEQTAGLAYAMFITPDSYYHSLHKSVDYGETWTVIDEVNEFTPVMMGGFAWFFGQIASLVDPSDNQEKLFLCGVDLWTYDPVIDDWFQATPPWWEYSVHADKHAIVQSPDGSILLGTDGGLYRNYGLEGWEDIENIPNNMFYRVAYNPHQPDLYYGGMQDNGTASGSVDDINTWDRIFGGDGFQAVFNPDNPDVMYAETQNGSIYYNDGYGFSYLDQFPIDSDRRNWDMPYMMSPHNNDVLYTGTYRAVKIQFSEFIPFSDELTDELEFISSYHTITALDESPLEEGLLYYGTADGNVWMQEDGGDFVSIIDGLPKAYVTSVKASPNIVDRVYVTMSLYLFNDQTPRIFRSDDRGQSWEPIANGLPTGAVNDVVVYDDFLDSILFVATNIGVYASIDAGNNWERMGENLPTLPVRDMVINEEKNELVAGTYGRSINSYPIDSVISTFNYNPPSSLKGYEEISFSLFPNPAQEFIVIDASESMDVKIFSAAGKLVKNGISTGERISITDLAQGTYLVQVSDGSNKLGLRRFIKQSPE